MDEPIYVNKLLTSDNEIMVNKVVPASQRENLSFIKIDTDLVGFYDNSIEVHTQFKDEIRETKNNISFFQKNILNLLTAMTIVARLI